MAKLRQTQVILPKLDWGDSSVSDQTGFWEGLPYPYGNLACRRYQTGVAADLDVAPQRMEAGRDAAG